MKRFGNWYNKMMDDKPVGTTQAKPTDDTQIKSRGVFSDLSNFQRMYANKGKFKNQLDEIVQAMQKGGGVEKEPSAVQAPEGKSEIITEILTTPELEKTPELSGYIETAEKAGELTHPVMDDYTNQVLLGSANPQKVKIKLPLEESQIEEGLHHKAWEAIRWLAEWCMRQLKIIKSKEVIETAEI